MQRSQPGNSNNSTRTISWLLESPDNTCYHVLAVDDKLLKFLDFITGYVGRHSLEICRGCENYDHCQQIHFEHKPCMRLLDWVASRTKED